jgi:penicillin amidase
MRVFKKIILILTVLIFALFVVGFLYYEWDKPSYSGPQKLKGLSAEVEVYFDKFGIPHIYALTDEDAYMALGYLHAQDRLWQMELIRRIAPGRLSELFGVKLVETDRFFKTLGIHQNSVVSAKDLEASNNATFKMANAYIKGVNTFIDKGPTPIEFTLTGAEKTPFTLVDVHNVVGYMSFSFAIGHKTDPLVTYLSQLDSLYMSTFNLQMPANSTLIKSNASEIAYAKISVGVNSLLDKLPLSPFIGSNSWVISAKKSKSGKPVLSNDPHIGFSQPSVWYEAHLVSPGTNYYGYHLAGNPFANLSHSEHTATGLTMFENDDLDYYREKVNPENEDQYWAIDHWENFDKRTETIVVKDSASEVFEVKTSRHGPIMNGTVGYLKDAAPLAAWWTYFKFPNKQLEASHKLATAKNIGEMHAAAPLLHAPGLNVMYADSEDNIAWWAAGKLVKRPAHVNPSAVLDGASGLDDPIGYYDFSENPQMVNPKSGFVYSANNQSVLNIKDTTILYPGYYLPDDRAKRIVQVMESKEKFSREDLKALFLDDKNINIEAAKAELIAGIDVSLLDSNEAAALEVLKNWDCIHGADTKGAQVYYAWVSMALELAMLDEIKKLDSGMADDVFNAFLETHLMKTNMLNFLAQNESTNPWWDNVATADVETRGEILTAAFKGGIKLLTDKYGENMIEKPWGEFHILEHNHALGAVEALRPYFNVGPFGVSGAENTLNNLGFSFKKDELFKVTYGPSTRRIIDFADINSSESVLPTGQSGNIFSAHYKDQAELYNKGEWRPMLFSKEDVLANQQSKVILKP